MIGFWLAQRAQRELGGENLSAGAGPGRKADTQLPSAEV